MRKLKRKEIIEKVSKLILTIVFLVEVGVTLFCGYYCTMGKISVLQWIEIIFISTYCLGGIVLTIKCIEEILKDKK